MYLNGRDNGYGLGVLLGRHDVVVIVQGTFRSETGRKFISLASRFRSGGHAIRSSSEADRPHLPRQPIRLQGPHQVADPSYQDQASELQLPGRQV